ncbi:MAG: DinB family protein [Planctomycetota bacterium]
MSQTAVSGIANNAKIVAGYAEALCKGIPADRFARFAVGQNGPIISNHPAWVCGHLSLYPGRAAGMLNLDVDVDVPDAWEALFGPKSECIDDADGSRYPAMAELVNTMIAHQRAIAGALTNIDDAALAAPTPIERYRDRFPTIMTAVDFLITTHQMLHLGQLSAWRRMEGLGSAT